MTINDPEIMKQVIVEINSYQLNQTQGTPLTIEPLLSLKGIINSTSISQYLLNGRADTVSMKISSTIRKYLNNLKQNKVTITTKK